MRQQRKPTFDEWMRFLKETRKLREKQQKRMKTPTFVMILRKPPVVDGLANDCFD